MHAATGFTPFELVYGRVAKFSIHIPTEEKLLTYNLYLQDLIVRLDEMKFAAGEHQIAEKQKTKTRYDQKTKTFKGRPGGYAWVLLKPRISKFDSYYKKPLKIVEMLGKNNVLLELPNGKRIRKHADKLISVPPGPEERIKD